MTKVSTSNNNQEQTQQYREINKYTTFFPGFDLQKEQFQKVKTPKGKPWPRSESPLEIKYQQFVIDCVNTSNNCFNMPLDENGYPITMPDNGPACRYVIHTIVRIKTLQNSEKLYSLGQLIGYDGASIRRTMACDKPEVWESVKFGYEKRYNSKTKRFDVYTTGPSGGIEIKYLLDFNQENFDSLYAKTWDGKNEYFKPNRRNFNKRVTLIVKDEATGTAIEVFWQSLERSIELFTTRAFSELFTGSYLPLAVREERARFSRGLLDEQQKTEPTSPDVEKAKSMDPDIKNTSAYK
ncbi:MAG TPA: hypothetical protein VJ697_13165 [Nitrososphaeraceae archaeon]|nr:hypothetical protein [Nitrososphaeraceae archaeon]